MPVYSHVLLYDASAGGKIEHPLNVWLHCNYSKFPQSRSSQKSTTSQTTVDQKSLKKHKLQVFVKGTDPKTDCLGLNPGSST